MSRESMREALETALDDFADAAINVSERGYPIDYTRRDAARSTILALVDGDGGQEKVLDATEDHPTVYRDGKCLVAGKRVAATEQVGTDAAFQRGYDHGLRQRVEELAANQRLLDCYRTAAPSGKEVAEEDADD